MKKTIVLGILLICLVSINYQTKAIDEEIIFEKTTSKILNIASNDELQEVNNGYLITNNNKITYIYDDVKVLDISSEYFTHVIDNDNLYLISKSDDDFVLSRVNKKTKKNLSISLDIDNPIDIDIINEELIIIGSNNNDAVICKYDRNLNYLHSYSYGGDGYESFIKLYEYLGDYYIIGSKDALSTNGPFLNVGNRGERKVFLTKINKQGIIIDTVYFNNQKGNEVLISSDFSNGIMAINIEAEDVNYIYYLNKELKTINYFEQINKGKTLGVMSYTNDYLVVQEGISLSLIVNDEVYDLETKGVLKKVIIDDNVLEIYYYSDYYLWEMKVYQYQIIHKEDIVVNMLDTSFNEKIDMNTLPEIKIKSFIHKLDLKLESINPLLNKQVHGTYNATFKIVINENKSYYLDNKVIVEEYINIYNNHTYPVGYSLKFTGYALLDGKSIAYGYKVNDEGVHNLVVTDAFGNKNKYTFRIINSDYYKKVPSDLDYIKPDYIINKNQEVCIKISTFQSVKEVYINNELTEFENTESGVVIKISNIDKIGMNKVVINKIVFDDDEYLLEKTVLIKVLKDAPSVEINEISEDDLLLKLNILDLDKSLENIKFVVYDKEKVVDEYYFDYLQNSITLGNIPIDNGYKIKGFLMYDVGNGVINEVSFFEIIVNTSLENYEIISWDINDNNIDIRIHTSNPDLKLENLKIGIEELNSKYQIVNNYKPIYISIILSLIVIALAGIYYFYKRKISRK